MNLRHKRETKVTDVFTWDQINAVDRQTVMQAVFQIIDNLQVLTPQIQVTASAILMVLLARHLEIDVRQVLDVSENILRDTERENPELLRATNMYIQEEIK